MTEVNSIIIGAGIGGLTAALALQKFGIFANVYEQASSLGEVGAGIMLTPNAVRSLEYLGLSDALTTAAVEPEDSVYRRFDSSEEILRAPLQEKMLSTYGARYFHVHRADLHTLLKDALLAQNPEAINLGYAFQDYSQKNGRVKAFFANGESVEGDFLVACDGIHSTMRGLLFGSENPRYTGQAAWRGMVPTKGLPKSIVEPSSVSWIGEQKHIIQYGVRQRKFINYVAIMATDDWTEEGWNCPAQVSEVINAFEGWHEDVLCLLQATPHDNCYKWGLFDRNPLNQWTKGLVTLLGDAAHPMLPFMAQGSAMAIEDAVVIGRALSSGRPIESSLQNYESVRRERTNWILEQSRKATNIYQRITGDKTEQRASNLDAVYGYDSTSISV